MAKLSLTDLANLTNEATAIAAINANSAAIEAAVENTLSRDGTSPNSMNANLDMNSYRIQNLPEPIAATEPVRKGDVESLVSALTETTKWYYGTDIPDASQYEIGDYYLRTSTADIYYKTNSTTWTLILNIKGDTGNTGPEGPGSGDMLQATYDSDSDGIVDAAESVPWAGITSKPTTMAGYNITSVDFSLLANKPTTLSGYGITDGQPLNSKLTTLGGQTWAADTFPYFTGASTAATSTITAAGRALLDDASAAAQRTTLGLGLMAERNAISTGDIVAGAVTLSRLDTTGVNGHVLTAKGAGVSPQWEAPSSIPSPAYTLITTAVPVTATASLTVSGLNLSQYVRVFITFNNMQFSASASFRIAGIVVSALSGSATGLVHGYIECNLLSGHAFAMSSVGTSTTTTAYNIRPNVLNASTSIVFSPSTGTFTAGTSSIRIYGVK